jgi:putative colanic acid biosynthesis acetyltransferase WcaF
MKTQLSRFNPQKGLDRGASRPVEWLWYACKCLFFLSPIPWPNAFKRSLLRCFGASIGKGVNLKPRINIHLPWKLSIGDHCWIGEEAFILNFEQVSIGDNCCLSQRCFLCTGNHDYRSEDFAFRNAPITLGNGVWIGAQSFVGPGVVVGDESVVAAASAVTTSLPPNSLCKGNPCQPCGTRWNQNPHPTPMPEQRLADRHNNRSGSPQD